MNAANFELTIRMSIVQVALLKEKYYFRQVKIIGCTLNTPLQVNIKKDGKEYSHHSLKKSKLRKTRAGTFSSLIYRTKRDHPVSVTYFFLIAIC
jgi:hypothetical protein